MQDNRRREPRRELGAFVTVLFDNKAALGLGTDISSGGMFIRSTEGVNTEPSSFDGPIVVQIDLPGRDDSHYAFGRARRAGESSNGLGTGLEFTYVPAETAEELTRFMAA